jgi:hypothetical protein
MEELMVEIIEIKVYLAEPVMDGNHAALPLGVMGEVMSSELEQELNGLLEQAHYMTREKGVDNWEKLKTSIYLHKKIAMLVTITRIIAQLPAASAQARFAAIALTERIAEQCKKIDAVLNALVSESINIDEPKLSKI